MIGGRDVNCVLGDFSSAWDQYSSQNLFKNGPSSAEQTNEYAPPEVLFGDEKRGWIPFDDNKPESYDSWSIGVVALEMLLGSPNVFSVDQRTTALLCHRMQKEGVTDNYEIRRVLYFAALSQFCIYVPTTDENWPLREGDPLHRASIVKTTCTLQDFHFALQARDPLGIGFDSSWDPLLKLIWKLLAWDPKERITAEDALQHFYFTSPSPSPLSSLYSHQHETNDKENNINPLSPGEHNALEPQILGPRVETRPGEPIIDEFICPKCGRKFRDWNSCQSHSTGRGHAKVCDYDRSSLPPCLNAHSMLPAHPTSGYCDIQGRRRVIEDFHTVNLFNDQQFYGIFDGHNGNLASKYAASSLYGNLKRSMKIVNHFRKDVETWKQKVADEITVAFQELHEDVVEVIKSYPGKVMSQSGTTATALFVTKDFVIIANVGDSRAILSIGTSYDVHSKAGSLQLTVDHIASNDDERKRVETLGGFVASKGGTPRVNGTLVLSRSLGDVHFDKLISRVPHVVVMTKDEIKGKCRRESEGISNDPEIPCFIILASDGLWDEISNQEAIDIVTHVIQKYDPKHGISWEDGGAFQESAQILTEEAYVRGSTDNIAVCVVAVQ